MSDKASYGPFTPGTASCNIYAVISLYKLSRVPGVILSCPLDDTVSILLHHIKKGSYLRKGGKKKREILKKRGKKATIIAKEKLCKAEPERRETKSSLLYREFQGNQKDISINVKN